MGWPSPASQDRAETVIICRTSSLSSRGNNCLCARVHGHQPCILSWLQKDQQKDDDADRAMFRVFHVLRHLADFEGISREKVGE